MKDAKEGIYIRLGKGLIKKGFLGEVMMNFEKYVGGNQMEQ